MHKILPFTFLWLAAPAWATTAARASLNHLVLQSELIVVATAGDSRSEWDGTRIMTRTSISVEEVWQGESSASTLEVSTLGGVVDDIGQRVAGAVRLHAGDRVVLCLQRRRGRLHIVEMGQGAFFVGGSDANEETVQRRTFGMHLVGSQVLPMPSSLRSLRQAIYEVQRGTR